MMTMEAKTLDPVLATLLGLIAFSLVFVVYCW